MEEKQAGITALVTAYARAYHARHDSPKIFDDFLADQLFTTEEHFFFDQNISGLLTVVAPELAERHPDQATALSWAMQLHCCPITLGRSRYTEDCLEEALKRGAAQYVILGAGFDTFAFRRPELAGRLEVFEVDHPVTQGMKRQRIAAAGWEIPPHLHYVPLDFSKESLGDALKYTGFDPEKLSFFSWLGVTYYLNPEDIDSTLRSIAKTASQGSTVIFDYMEWDALGRGNASKSAQTMQGIVRQAGEPMKTGLDPDTLAADLKRWGLVLQENLNPSEIENRYFQNRSDLLHAPEYIHFAQASIRQP